VSRTGSKNPHRSGRKREPGRFEETFTDMRVPKADEISTLLIAKTQAEGLARQEAVGTRNRAADAAYEAALVPARLSLGDPSRVPYPEAAKRALAAYDAVMEKWKR
jgi:hypothetical protein